MKPTDFFSITNYYIAESINERASDMEGSDVINDIVDRAIAYIKENSKSITYTLGHWKNYDDAKKRTCFDIPFSKFMPPEGPLQSTILRLCEYYTGLTPNGTYNVVDDEIELFFGDTMVPVVDFVDSPEYRYLLAHEIAHALNHIKSKTKSFDSAKRYMNGRLNGDAYFNSTEEINARFRGTLSNLKLNRADFISGKYKTFEPFKKDFLDSIQYMDELSEYNKRKILNRAHSYWAMMSNKETVTETDKKYADANSISLINGLLGGSKNVSNAVNQYKDMADIPAHVGLMANLELAKKNYKAMFDDKGRLKNKFDSAEILKRKKAVDDAEMALVQDK